MNNHNLMDYRLVIRNELDARTQRNPNYSLRAYARDLNMLPSHLHQVMNGKSGISVAVAKAIAEKINLTPTQTAFFCDSVTSIHDRSKLNRENAKLRLAQYQKDREYKEISEDHFAIISDWFHMAILELLDLKNFQLTAQSAAEKLNISVDTSQEAIERLLRVGMLERKNDVLEASSKFTNISSPVPSTAIRKFHQQILDLAKNALHNQELANRDFSSVIIATEKEQIENLKERIKKFRRELSQEIVSSENKNSIYNLSIQLFELGR